MSDNSRRLTAEIEIACPRDKVFAYVADQRNYTSWCPRLTSCRMTSDGAVGAGATRTMTRRALGMRFEWAFVCLEH